jgi:predicted ABC-type sugar transport system permease subunit
VTLLAALAGSAALATLSGVAQHVAMVADTDQFQQRYLLFAVAAVLLAGPAVHGRSGPIAGTVLAVFVVEGLTLWIQVSSGTVSRWVLYSPLALAAVLGLIVGRAVDALSRPRRPAPAVWGPVPVHRPVDGSVPEGRRTLEAGSGTS